MFFENRSCAKQEHYFMDIGISTGPCRLHIHEAFECYAVKKGHSRAIINGVEYELSPGEAVLVFPYQGHEYKTEPDTVAWVCVFSPVLVGSFNKRLTGIPKSNKFLFDPCDEAMPENLMLKKVICYKICGTFDTGAEYTDISSEKESLLSKILHFISDHYTEECTLEYIARSLGYDCNYLSKFFKRMTGQSCKSYVNSLRVGEACRLLSETDAPVSDIAEDCGFGSTRSFNREFLSLTGKTPREYRKQ